MEIGRRADPDFRRRLATLSVLSLVAATFELATLGSLVPLLSALSGEARPAFFPGALPQDPLHLVLIFAVVVLLAAIARLSLAAAIQRGVLHTGHRINSAIQRRLLAQPYLFHAATNSSRFVAALHKTDQLVLGLLGPLLQGVAGLVIGGAIFAFLLGVAGWKLTLGSALFIGGAYLIFSRIAGRRLVRRGGQAVAAHEEQVRLMMESSGAIRDILLDHRQQAFGDAFDDASLRMTNARAGTDLLNQAPRFLIEALGAVAMAGLAAWVAAREGSLAGSLPLFGLLALAMIRIVPLAQIAYRGWTMLQSNRQAIGDVSELLALPDVSANADPAPRLPLEKELRLDGVTFTYPGGPGPVLSDANLQVSAGEWVGLTGPTGGGKSTLADLVMGLLPPDSGCVSVDGRALTPELILSWQQSVAHVSQAVYLIDDTVAANIMLTPGDTGRDLERVRKCAAIAQLDPWIATLADGLENLVGDRGRRLSGGQRQRIAIARALYKQAPVLVLDEATGALDLATEAALLDSIRTEYPGITVLLISHRPAALDRCDRVVTVEGGRVTPA